MNQFSTLKASMRYRGMGLSIIPLWPKSKKPLLKWERYQKAQPTKDELFNWFANGEANNIGIVTGAVSGIVVLDVDDPKAVQGRPLPHTPTVKTAKGYHYYFKHPEDARPMIEGAYGWVTTQNWSNITKQYLELWGI